MAAEKKARECALTKERSALDRMADGPAKDAAKAKLAEHECLAADKAEEDREFADEGKRSRVFRSSKPMQALRKTFGEHGVAMDDDIAVGTEVANTMLALAGSEWIETCKVQPPSSRHLRKKSSR